MQSALSVAEDRFLAVLVLWMDLRRRSLSICDRHEHRRDEVLFMFEEGDTGQSALERRVAQDFGVKIRTGPKVPDPKLRYELPILPLQPADFAFVARSTDIGPVGQ